MPDRYEFCRVYVRDADRERVRELVPVPPRGVSAELRHGDEWPGSSGDFLSWPTHVEVFQPDGRVDRGIVAAAQALLDSLAAAGVPAVASSDFEDELR